MTCENIETLAFPEFPAGSDSLLKKYLTRDLFEKYKNLRTARGFSLGDVIRSGVENSDSSIGLYAGDMECYSLYSDLFKPVIEEYHGVAAGKIHRTDLSLFDREMDFIDDPEGLVISTRIRVGRNLAGFSLGAGISREDRLSLEKKVADKLRSLDGDLEGEYHSLSSMDEERQKALIESHLLFKEGDRFLAAAGLTRDWPSGRGIFMNRESSFLVWLNEEDHLRVISMEKGCDVGRVYRRLLRGLGVLDSSFAFQHDRCLGFISSCPTNLGTSMRASVHIRLKRLEQQKEELSALADRYNLQIRGTRGEHSGSEDCVFDVSNRRRLGISERECLSDLIMGTRAIIKKEMGC